MKIRNKAMSLVLASLCVVSLASCNDVTASSDGKILTYKYNDQKLEISTNDIIEKYIEENRTEHAKAFYDALYEIIVRASFEKKDVIGKDSDGILANYKDDMIQSAKEAVEKAKNEAETAGQSWHDYLVSQGYDDANMKDSERENELFLDKLYTAMKTRVDTEYNRLFTDWNKANNSDNALQQKYNVLWGDNGFINDLVPYHVKHILVKVDASDTNGYARGHISSDNAHKLYQTVTSLVNGNEFGNVAKNFSDDPGSNTKGGEYIMNTKSGFVNEFQLGIYAYDLLLNDDVNTKKEGKQDYTKEENYKEKYDNLHIPEDVKNDLTNFGATFIPYGVINELEQVKDVTTKNGKKVYNGDEDYLPRNIYFNKYFQNRNVAFITDEALLTTKDLIGDGNTNDYKPVNSKYYTYDRVNPVSGKTVYSDINDSGRYETGTGKPFSGLTEEQKKNFHKIEIKQGDSTIEKNVLCDTEGNPILVVRNQESSAGIHFIVIERSGFDNSNIKFNYEGYAKEGVGIENEQEMYTKYSTTLAEYYATSNPKLSDEINQKTGKPYYVSDFPHVKETINSTEVNIPKKTYVQSSIITKSPENNVRNTVQNYKDRIANIDDGISKLGNIADYNKYNWLNATLNISINEFITQNGDSTGETYDIQGLVEDYINIQERAVKRSTAKEMQDKWIAYNTDIKKQTSQRQYNLLPEILATEFGVEALYKEGAPGYNPKYSNIDGTGSGQTSGQTE